LAKLAISTLWLAELARLVWTGLGQAGLAVVNCPECRRDSAALGLAHAGLTFLNYSEYLNMRSLEPCRRD